MSSLLSDLSRVDPNKTYHSARDGSVSSRKQKTELSFANRRDIKNYIMDILSYLANPEIRDADIWERIYKASYEIKISEAEEGVWKSIFTKGLSKHSYQDLSKQTQRIVQIDKDLEQQQKDLEQKQKELELAKKSHSIVEKTVELLTTPRRRRDTMLSPRNGNCTDRADKAHITAETKQFYEIVKASIKEALTDRKLLIHKALQVIEKNPSAILNCYRLPKKQTVVDKNNFFLHKDHYIDPKDEDVNAVIRKCFNEFGRHNYLTDSISCIEKISDYNLLSNKIFVMKNKLDRIGKTKTTKLNEIEEKLKNVDQNIIDCETHTSSIAEDQKIIEDQRKINKKEQNELLERKKGIEIEFNTKTLNKEEQLVDLYKEKIAVWNKIYLHNINKLSKNEINCNDETKKIFTDKYQHNKHATMLLSLPSDADKDEEMIQEIFYDIIADPRKLVIEGGLDAKRERYFFVANNEFKRLKTAVES